MLSLLRRRPGLSLRVVHLDHQTRGGASTEDANFVESQAAEWKLPAHIAQLEDVVKNVRHLPKNRSARFRAARQALFRQVVNEHGLMGVLLAHHADDQAETILLRLLRGSGYAGLVGMSRASVVAGLTILRPMLDVRRQMLRDHLIAAGQAWREDESNASPQYARNRVRRLMQMHPALVLPMIELGEVCGDLLNWADALPMPAERWPLRRLQELPSILARRQARKWLVAHGAITADLTPVVLDQLIAMARDRATPARQHFPGGVSVRRRGEVIFVEGSGVDGMM